MRKRESVPVPAVGGASLLVGFAVLCFAVFAMLSLSTALTENRMARSALESVTSYYAADLEAQEIFARLRRGEQVPGTQTDGDHIFYTCVILENQKLRVQLQRTGDTWTVLRWQMVAEDGTGTDTLPVWDGD